MPPGGWHWLAGWLGSALGRAVLERGLVAEPELVLLNRSGTRPSYHGRTNVAWASNVSDLVALVEVVVLAVRAEDYGALALQAPGRLVLSILAGILVAALSGAGGRIVRAMPHAAAEQGQFYTSWLTAADVTRRALSAPINRGPTTLRPR